MMSDEDFVSTFKACLSKAVESSFDIKFSKGDSSPRLRMSSIGGCARRIYYSLVESATDSVEHPWQTALGYAGQAIVTEVLRLMGYEVRDQEKSVSLGGVDGHVDGILFGGDLGDKKAVWDCKIRNSFSLRDLMTKGLPAADKVMYMQLQGYIAAEDADLGIITVHPFDLSDTRSRLRQYKVENDPLVHRIVLEPDEEAKELIIERATLLRLAVKSRILPAREYDPEKKHTKFPCGVCSYMTKCLTDGDTRDFIVSPLPSKWDEPTNSS